MSVMKEISTRGKAQGVTYSNIDIMKEYLYAPFKEVLEYLDKFNYCSVAGEHGRGFLKIYSNHIFCRCPTQKFFKSGTPFCGATVFFKVL